MTYWFRKYSDTQPREPAGSPIGGRWTAVHGDSYQREELGRRVEEYKTKAGLLRTRTVIDFAYKDFNGRPITDPATLERIKKLVIPPGVSNVRINPDPEGHRQAVWTDAKGRDVTKYSLAHDVAQSAAKFARVKDFSEALPEIREKILRDLESKDPEIREAATVLYLIDKTGFRVGSTRETGGDVQAYGASTLLGKHVTVTDNVVKFSFEGKHGVEITKTVRDAMLAKLISERKTKQWSRPLFDTNDGRIRNYLKSLGGDFKVKDFRTHTGTGIAYAEISRRKGPAKDEKTFAKWQSEVATKVAKELGNTKSVALGSYIDPHVWDKWRRPEWGAYVPPKLQKSEVDDYIREFIESVVYDVYPARAVIEDDFEADA